MRMLEGHFYHVTCLVLFDLGIFLPMQSKSRIIGLSLKMDWVTPLLWVWWWRMRLSQDYVLSAWNRQAWNSPVEQAAESGTIQSAHTLMACISNSPEGTAFSKHDSPVPSIILIVMSSIRSTSAGSSVTTGGLPIWPTSNFNKNIVRNSRKRPTFYRVSEETQPGEWRAVARCSKISNATNPVFLDWKKRNQNSHWVDPRRTAKMPLPILSLPIAKQISPKPVNCWWRDRNASTNDFNALLAISLSLLFPPCNAS